MPGQEIESRISVVDGSEMIATASLRGIGKPAVTIYQLYVVNRARGKGLGSEIVKHAEDIALAHGAFAMSAVVEPNGPLGFWDELGYEVVHSENGNLLVSKRLIMKG